MAIIDFAIRHDFNTEDINDLSKKLIYTLVLKRIRNHKPTFMFIGGDSGEGKSLAAITIQMIFYEIQRMGWYDQLLQPSNIFRPKEYMPKVHDILYNKKSRVNSLIIHEMRYSAKASKWNSFQNQAIADIMNTQRSIKKIFTIMVSQFIRDIDLNLRYLINYYCEIERGLGKSFARLKIWKMYKDTKDIEKPQLKKRRLQGYLIQNDGSYIKWRPEYLEMRMPPKEIRELVKKYDTSGKSDQTKIILERLAEELDSGVDSRLDNVIKYLSKNLEDLGRHTQRGKNGVKLKSSFFEVYGISKQQRKEAEGKLNETIKI